MNLVLFFGHILLMILFVLGALRMGKQALVMLVAICALLANLFVVKQTNLFGLTVTCSDVFAVGGILGLNLLQEYFGPQEAKQALRISFLGLFFFALMALVHLAYIPSENDVSQDAFSLIFSSTPRIIGASFITFYLVQKWDICFFQWLQRRLQNRLTFRIWISLLVSQAIDTVLFSLLGLYGIVDSIGDIMFMSYLLKCCIIALASPLSSFSKRLVKEISL